MFDFKNSLINWYEENKRNLPWRKSVDPYKIWLSEIILQQTRVAQGLPYYQKFINRFPTVFDLAQADEEEVLKLWQGLGYYSRARNLHYTAQIIVQNEQGVFPNAYQELIRLKGIGDYTASAISSICFNEPKAVLDGNVFRVISRIFGIDLPINSTEGKKIFKEKANELLDRQNPGTYNQAIMEFGALHCKPKLPLCETCPFQRNCVAFQQGIIDQLPVKLKKVTIRKRYLNYLIFSDVHNNTLIHKRNKKDIWMSLYEFPLIETEKILTKKELLQHEFVQENRVEAVDIELFNSKSITHQLTHQKLMLKFWILQTPDVTQLKFPEKYRKINQNELEKFPVPIVIHNFLKAFEFKF